MTVWIHFCIFYVMKKIDYEALAEKLTEEYPIEENPEIYSLYTSMKQHLMKVYKLKATTAHKFLVKVEERLGIHLMRDRELTAMKMIHVTKGNDVKRYFRILYWTTKLPLETLDAIIKKHGDVNCRLVKKFLRDHGDMPESKFNEFKYAQNYYREHRKELLEKKRLYRQKKRLDKNK